MPRVQPIRPRLYDVRAIERQIVQAKEKGGRQAKRKLEATSRTWTGAKPMFEIRLRKEGGDLVLYVRPKPGSEGYDKWIWLDKGTRRHPISAKRAPTLAFRWPGFLPKTTPRVLKAGLGRRATGPLRRPIEVMHPGTKPRYWSETVTEEMSSILIRLERLALQRGLQARISA